MNTVSGGELNRSVAFLHNHGFVHGDIRITNVLVSESTSKALLIDFDEAGLDGKVYYPPHLNTVDIVRPEEAIDGKPITKAH